MDEQTFFGMSMTNMVIPTLLILLGGVVTMGGTFVIRRKDATKAAITKRDDERERMQGRVAELETQLRIIKESVQPISMAFQQILIKELTHLNEPRTDELLKKIGPPYTLNDAEETELISAMNKRVADNAELMTDTEIDAAKMLPMLIRRVKAELAMGIPPAGDDGTDLKIVGVPADNGPQK